MAVNNLQLAAWLPRSRANGPGLRSVVWVQGCPFRCPGCFNPDFLPFAGGRTVAAGEVAAWILAQQDTEGVSFSGGEPFAQAGALADVSEPVRAAGKGVLIFTGFESATLRQSANPDVQRLLAAADLLVAGPYQRDNPGRHPLLASANQELVFLTERYRRADFGPCRTEFRIGGDGAVTVTGFPPHPVPPPRGGRGRHEGIRWEDEGVTEYRSGLFRTSLPPLWGKDRMGGSMRTGAGACLERPFPPCGGRTGWGVKPCPSR